MSQDQRPPRVRLTRVTEATTPRPRGERPGFDADESISIPRPRHRLIPWSTVVMFIIACLIGGMLTAVFDLPGYLLS